MVNAEELTKNKNVIYLTKCLSHDFLQVLLNLSLTLCGDSQRATT